MKLFDVVSNTAVTVTLASFLTGLPVCSRIWTNRSTKSISPFPFMSGFLSTTLWLNYSHLVGDPSMIFVNTTGFVCFLFYNLFFISMASKNQTLLRQYALLSAILFALLYGPILSANRLENSGLIACVCGLAFFASPLFQLKRIVTDKDVSSLPFWMILFSFFTSVLWLMFGILINDNYVKLPNAIATVLSGFQLSLFAIYPSRRDTIKEHLSLLKDSSESI